MSRAQKIDVAYFLQYPTAYSYNRAPQAGEFPEIAPQEEWHVTVYKISDHYRDC